MLSPPSIIPQPKNRLSNPILAPILENHSLTVIITSSGLLHGGLAILGWPSWQCPLRYQLGIPCPGCGLSRAIAVLLHGDWKTSLTFHMVLIKLFQEKGVLHGILGIICSLYTFIWGWMNAGRLNIKNIMIAWSVAIVVGIILQPMLQ